MGILCQSLRHAEQNKTEFSHSPLLIAYMFSARTNIRVVPISRAILIVLYSVFSMYVSKRLYHVTSMLPFDAFRLESAGKPLSFVHESDALYYRPQSARKISEEHIFDFAWICVLLCALGITA